MGKELKQRFRGGSIPASAGIGLRAPHESIFVNESPAVAWLEVHSENYFRFGGRAEHTLTRIRERYPLSLHGVGLSLGSTDPLDYEHLDKLREAIDRYEPGLVSEHLSWSSVDGSHLNDLLPLPSTREALDHLTQRIECVQSFLGREILIENVSSYLQYADADMPEHVFFGELVRRTGCGVLLDVNNLYVNECNHGSSALAFIQGIPLGSVGEIHLAGHSVQCYDEHEIVVDTHDAPVCAEVWTLYEAAVGRFGRVPTLVEWDSSLPALESLIWEAQKAQQIMDSSDVHAS
jgi:uncharacterized protein (UPF0276 family)